MPDCEKGKLLRWLRQVAQRPRFMVVADGSAPIRKTLGDLGCDTRCVQPRARNLWREIGSQRSLVDRFIIVSVPAHPLPDGLLESLPQERTHCLPSHYSEELVRQVVYDAIADCRVAPSRKQPSEKDGTSRVPHHRPRIATAIIADICAEPEVARVRYRKGGGPDRSAAILDERIVIAVEDGFGLLVDPVCGHPAHLARVLQRVQVILDAAT